MQRSFFQRALIICGIAFFTVSFQNCESNTSQDIAGTDNQKNNTEALNCPVPWQDGLLVINGKSVVAFQSETVAEGESCQQEDRLCTDGTLSGSFQFAGCQVQPAQAQNCAVPWADGLVVEHGKSVAAFKDLGDGTCDEEVRTCNNSELSGSFSLASCPVVSAGSCKLPDGQDLANGMIQKLKLDNTPFADTDCGDYVEYTCTDAVLTSEKKNLECPDQKSCELPWGGALAHGKTVSAYKNAEAKDGAACEGENKEVRACADGVLSGSFTNKACKPKETAKELECKVHFKGGASAATKVKNKDQCLSYYAQIKANNPKSEIVKLTLDKKEIAIPKEGVKGDYVAYKVVGGKKTKLESKKDITLAQARIACRAQVVKDAGVGYECTFNGLMFERVEEPKAKECKIAFQGGGSIASQQKSEDKCKAYWAEVKKNNPQNEIAKVTFGTKVLYTAVKAEKKECKVTFHSGASSASKVADRKACEAYFAEIKKNNPKQKIRSVTFDGQMVFLDTSDMGILKITITKGSVSNGLGIADITLDAAKKRCDSAIKDNPGAAVTCEFNGKIIKQVKEEVPDSKKVCKVFFAGGGSAATDVKDKAGCEKYHAEIKKNNPQNEISKVTFDGKVIYEKKAEDKKTCKIFFASGASVATDVKDRAACDKNHAEIKKNNPGQTITKVTFAGTVIYEQKPVDNKKVCKVTFKSGASVSSKVETKAKCEAYSKEIKKNNPTQKVQSVTFDGKAL
ncbi:MAG: hypothetical protein KF767_07925 [Bdellovibrionaceae bacterium]|nr:hypothetical protein [Pseudobdellovibrionaceae bacterium]